MIRMRLHYPRAVPDYDVAMTAADWLADLAARDDEFRRSIAPITADHVGELTMVEMQARLIAAAEGNSLRDAIIRSQSARIAELTAELEQRRVAGLPSAVGSVTSAVKKVADRSPTPIRASAYAGASLLRRTRRVLCRLTR